MTRAERVEAAAREVMGIALRLLDCDWPPDRNDVVDLVRRLEDTVRACDETNADPLDAEAASIRWAQHSIAKTSLDAARRRERLARSLAMLFAYAKTLSGDIQRGSARSTGIERIGLLAAAVLDAAADEHRELVRHERNAS